MKKMISVMLAMAMLLSVCCVFTGCGGNDGAYTVGICQLMVHDSLDQATQGFIDALQAEMDAAGKKVTFEQQLNRLEEIVAALEKGDARLADSLALFEEGTKLIAACSRQLDEAEQKVVQLMKGADGAPVELPFESEEG